MARHLAPYENPNNLAYWYPFLKRSGVDTPETRVLVTQCPLEQLLDGKMPPGYQDFVARLQLMVSEFKPPVFLRTGHFSGKHQWLKTCFVQHLGNLNLQVYRLVEGSALVDPAGLPVETWVVREYLDLNFEHRAFGNMPVAREFRVFLRDFQVQCLHPYWPPDALAGHSHVLPWLEQANKLSRAEREHLDALATRVGNALSAQKHPDWSIDFAQKRDGSWVAIDMALAAMSYHWEDCPHASKPLRLPARERVWMRSPARGHSRAGTRRRYANRKRG